MIYWTPISGSYFLVDSNLEKCGNSLKNRRFSRQTRPDRGNASWENVTRLGSIGLIMGAGILLKLYQVYELFSCIFSL